MTAGAKSHCCFSPPLLNASRSGLSFSELVANTSAPRANSNATASRLSFLIAAYSTESPFWFRAFSSAPTESRYSMSEVFALFKSAMCSGVLPNESCIFTLRSFTSNLRMPSCSNARVSGVCPLLSRALMSAPCFAKKTICFESARSTAIASGVTPCLLRSLQDAPFLMSISRISSSLAFSVAL